MNNMSKEKLLRIMKDPKMYLENFCRIKGKKPGLIPFILNEAQKDLFNAINTSNRVIILKSRQIGFSTAVTGYFYHNTITNPGTNTALIGYNSDLTAELLDKVKTFYNTTPEEIRPTLHYNSKYEISFPKINSKIIVLPSTENVGRGYTLNNVLCTELAFWDKQLDKMTALEASVPIDGRIVIESTPNGVGDVYHRTWMAKDNGYTKKEYGWWWGYTEEEIDKIRNRMNNPLRFAQEYGLEFLASGRPVFDVNVLKKQRENILKLGDKVKVGEDDFIVQDIDGIRVYKPPQKDGLYVVGVDVAEGVEGGDYSVAIIWDRKTGEEVAMYRGLLPPDIFANKLNKWGRWFNDALMVVEINNHGLTTVTCLRQHIYPTMYFRQEKFETISQKSSDKIGWKTTKVTKPLLIDDFAQAMRDKTLTIHSKELIDEMSVFVYDDNGNPVSMEGYHDDCIIAGGIAFQGFKILHDKPLDQLNYEKYLPVGFAY